LPEGRPLLRWHTALKDVLNRCNKKSQNLYAEALLKRAGHHMTGQTGTWINGAAAVRHALLGHLGTRATLLRIVDGSGMSRGNRVSAQSIVALLGAMHRDPQLAEPFMNSLSIAGTDGTLKKRMRDLHATVLGKSGYINGVCTLSGYLVYGDANAEQNPQPSQANANPRVVAFSFLFNDIAPPVYLHKVKALQDNLLRTFDRFLAPGGELLDLGA